MYKYLRTAAVSVLLSIMTIAACNKDQNCSLHPEAFRFSIIDGETGDDHLGSGTYSTDNIGIHYFYNNQKQELIVNIEPNPDSILVEMVSVQLPMVSLTGRSEIFYLVLNAQDTDTLTVIMGNEKRNSCDFHPYSVVKHNGENLPITEGKAFILKKRP
jgi:hypothetical protein